MRKKKRLQQITNRIKARKFQKHHKIWKNSICWLTPWRTSTTFFPAFLNCISCDQLFKWQCFCHVFCHRNWKSFLCLARLVNFLKLLIVEKLIFSFPIHFQVDMTFTAKNVAYIFRACSQTWKTYPISCMYELSDFRAFQVSLYRNWSYTFFELMTLIERFGINVLA